MGGLLISVKQPNVVNVVHNRRPTLGLSRRTTVANTPQHTPREELTEERQGLPVRNHEFICSATRSNASWWVRDR